MPLSTEFERKISEIYAEAQERLERRKSLQSGRQRQIDYFIEKSDDDDEE